MTTYPSDEGVPPRVLAAEARRRFRDTLENSSLYCQNCRHNKGEHKVLGAETTKTIRHGRCTHVGCTCESGDDKGKYDSQRDADLIKALRELE